MTKRPCKRPDWKRSYRDYHAIEIRPSRIVRPHEGIEIVELCDTDSAQFWAVHCYLKTGVAESVADFPTPATARRFANWLLKEFSHLREVVS